MLGRLDTNAFYLINESCAGKILDAAMPVVTQMGGGIVIFIVCLIFLFSKSEKMRKAGILIMAGLTISYYCISFLKGWAMRPRPFSALPDVRTLMKDGSFSFPSGHAARAFMSAAIASKIFGKSVLFFGLAALVAFSRVYLGVHYPSDVLAGAALGVLIGYCLVRVYDVSL